MDRSVNLNGLTQQMFISHSGKVKSRLGRLLPAMPPEYTTSKFISAGEERDKGNTLALHCLGLVVTISEFCSQMTV